MHGTDPARCGWPKLMAPSLGSHEMLGLYGASTADYLIKRRDDADGSPLRRATPKGRKTTGLRKPQ